MNNLNGGVPMVGSTLMTRNHAARLYCLHGVELTTVAPLCFGTQQIGSIWLEDFNCRGPNGIAVLCCKYCLEKHCLYMGQVIACHLPGAELTPVCLFL